MLVMSLWPSISSAATLPVPDQIADGATVFLQCGIVYQGTLELTGKRGVTVTTSGTCGKASISPRRAVVGWVKESGSVYSAPISFVPVQVTIGAVSIGAAHWPNKGWATGAAGMPHDDLEGATLVFRANQSVIQTQPLAGRSIATSKPFYVEGKLWMLDAPGEWAVQQGRLYVWAPDGRNPEGRAWAAPDANGINADESAGIVIENVAIFSATDGISANGASKLTVRNTDIGNCYRDGIWASGSVGLHVLDSRVWNARRNGIDGWYGINDAVIANSSVSNTGMVGMPTPSDGGIMFGSGANNRIDHVRVTQSAYHGINVMHNRNTVVRDSTIDASCRRLTDCGAIYTSARDRQRLDLLIEGNTVSNNTGQGAIGIYLDDHTNGVTVDRNTLVGNQRALVIHDGFNNIVSNNMFAASAVVHIGLAQSTGTVHDVSIIGNTFKSANGEQTFNVEGGANYRQFAIYDYNTYLSNNWEVFGHAWDGRSRAVATSFQGWKLLMLQDAHSVTIDAVSDSQWPDTALRRRK